MDRLDTIRLFVRLVESGSFSAVGHEEGIGQPAVSKQISALERYLGAQLVSRTSRRIVITDVGKMFYESAKQLVDDFDAVESSVGVRQQSPRGLIRFTTSPVHGRLCITPLLAEFFRRYPYVEIEMSASERNIDMIGERIDLALRHGPLTDSSLTAKKLHDVDVIIVASRRYLAANGTPTQVSDLDKHSCIVFARGGVRRPWLFRIGEEIVSYVPRGSLLTSDAEYVRAAVLSDIGMAQAATWMVADKIRSGELEVVLPNFQVERIPLYLLYPAGRRVSMKVRVLIDYLASSLKPPKF